MKIDHDQFIALLREQYFEEVGEINITTNFRTLPGWDSMTGMTILLMVEENFKIKIESEQFKKLLTIEDLYNFINQNADV